jgi:hypothetical protein
MLYERCVMTFKEVLKIQEVLGKKSPVDIRIIRKYIGTYQGEPE